MDTAHESSAAFKIFGGISFAVAISCFLLCCGTYILSRTKYKKQNQINFTNHQCSFGTPAQTFAIDMPDAHSSAIYPHDQPPPPYTAMEIPNSVHHESNGQASSPKAEQTA